ncbi:hypothetical protein [Streptomyces sp. NPDC000405]|uniref:hypothetical protein n=1 Tax=Streptomyces sp. NPDC000405 TaxID=3161033 RepID=UPI00398CEC71
MLRIGRAAGRAAEGGRARFTALMCATVLLTLAFACFVATSATYDGRDVRSAARAPVAVAAGERARAVWSTHWDSFQGRQFTVVNISPLDRNAPLPPGLPRWPTPGEVFLSPELMNGPATEDFKHRYGRVAGVISDEGLASPGERFAYVRPTAPMLATEQRPMRITGFGNAGAGSFGDKKIVKDAWTFYPVIAVLFALPALALAAAAARMGSEGRDRRGALLRVLGAGRRARACMDLGEALLPVSLGAVISAAVISAALLENVRLPWIDYVLSAADLRDAAAYLAGTVVLAMLSVIALVVLLHPVQRDDAPTTRPGAAQGGLLRLLSLGMCPAFAALAWLSGALFGGGRYSMLVYLTAAAGVLVTLPSAIGWVLARLVRPLALATRRRSKGPGLIAARVITARPGVVVRLVAALVVAIGVVGQTQMLSSSMANASGTAQQLHSSEGRTMVIVQGSSTARLGRDFLTALPEQAHVVSFGVGKPSGRAIQAPCPDLKLLALPCPRGAEGTEVPYGELDRRLRTATFEFYGPTPSHVRTGSLAKLGNRGTVWLAIFTEGGRDLDTGKVKSAIYQHLDINANIRTLAEAGGTSFDNGYHARWLTFFGIAGAIALLAAMGVSALAEFLRFGSGVAPISVLAAGTRLLRSTAVWLLGVPVLIAGIVGVSFHLFLAMPRSDSVGYVEHADWAPGLYAGMLTATAVLAAVISWAGGVAAVRKSRTWRPRAD